MHCGVPPGSATVGWARAGRAQRPSPTPSPGSRGARRRGPRPGRLPDLQARVHLGARRGDAARAEVERWFTTAYGNPALTDQAGVFGTPDEVAEQLEALVDAGATHLLLNPVTRYDEQVEALAALTGVRPNDVEQHPMSGHGVLLVHRTKPGRRADVRDVWMAHMAPAVAGNDEHLGVLLLLRSRRRRRHLRVPALRQRRGRPAASAVLCNSYRRYLDAVEPLLAGPPEIHPLAPMWTKGAPPDA